MQVAKRLVWKGGRLFTRSRAASSLSAVYFESQGDSNSNSYSHSNSNSHSNAWSKFSRNGWIAFGTLLYGITTLKSTLSESESESESESGNASTKEINDTYIKDEKSKSQSQSKASLPIYTLDEVKKHDNINAGAWVVYKDHVYDITKFIANHPGGKEKIMLAAGGDIAPYWNFYQQHFNTKLPMEILESLKIGKLHEDDYLIMQKLEAESDTNDPFCNDPKLSPLMNYHCKKPINAEAPGFLLTENWITPINLWFVRNHHPIPYVNVEGSTKEGKDKDDKDNKENKENKDDKKKKKEVEKIDYQLELEVNAAKSILSAAKYNLNLNSGVGYCTVEDKDKDKDKEKNKDKDKDKGKEKEKSNSNSNSKLTVSLNFSDLKNSFKPHTIVSTVQCGGNRRLGMNLLERTNGSPWDVSAISTAKWTGVRLRDILESVGITEDIIESDQCDIKHVIFEGVDGMLASIPIDKAISRGGDVLMAFEMNDEPLPPQHGYPLRAVIPGHVGVRNVKWVSKIVLSSEEATGPWQRGMSYKGFNPSVKSLEGIQVEDIPSLQEQPVQSAITLPLADCEVLVDPEDGTGLLDVKGYAYSGGGRGIVRVDVSIDGGKTWKTASLKGGSEQPLNRAWAWTLWECDFKLTGEDVGKKLEIISKATDASYNVQPDTTEGVWNLRGINNNSWHRVVSSEVKYEVEEEAHDDGY